jgi:TP901 family phage tail tape measure protein
MLKKEVKKMADDLKRVGLVFKEDGAVDFKKSLQEINLELNKNYNQFKLTQAQWDSSTKSTEKLRAEQEYLKNAYEIQTDKVNTLKMQLSDLENAENKNTTAIKKKRNELLNAEIKLETYNKKLKDIQTQLNNTGKKLEEFGTKVQNSGKKIEEAGKKMSAFSLATGTALITSAKSAIDFEDAFTGVEKTVDGTAEQMEELKQGIRDMAKEIPSSTTEISAVAEAAGQLGIKTEDILSFTKVMIDLGNSTNLSAEEAASSLAKFANVTKMSAKDYDKLGSTIVALGNNFATTEADIVAMATRLAATGELAGLSQSQILSLATAMSSVGIEAEAGGSAMSKLLKKIQLATELGGKDLEQFAKVAGMTSSEFKKAYEEDAVKALSAFIGGLNDTERNGKSAISILDDMGIKEVRLSNTILSLANASDIMTDAVKAGSEAWEDNTALTNEANKRYDTLKSKITIAVNKLKDMAITIGNKLMPSVEKVIDKVGKWIEKFEDLSDEEVDMIVKLGLIVTAAGPVITIFGKLTSTIGGVTKEIGTVVQAIGVMNGTITSTSTVVNGLASVFGAVTSPVGLACGAIALAVAGITIAVNNAEKDTREAFSNMGNAASDFITGIDSAQSHLNAFNSELFVSSEEQQKLQEQMDEIQKGITNICKTASDERRGYTQEEITQLDEYFTKLRELNQREIEIQQQISTAITQQATTNAETFKGSLEEYKIQAQEWLKTAEEQKTKTIELINNQTIEEVALLNTRYTTEEQRQSEAYQKEYNNIMNQKQAKIDAANEEVAKISEVYANGYLERSKDNDGWYTKLEEYNKKIEDENKRHNNIIDNNNNNALLTQYNKNQANEQENYRHQNETKKIWDKMYKDMSEEQEKELGVWLAQVAQTEMYGGKISKETQNMVDTIMDSYDSMPDDTKKVMKRTMEGMLNGMKDNEPSLFAKASGIANGILSRLRKSFDIHSPSRKTKAIFKNVMKRNGERN